MVATKPRPVKLLAPKVAEIKYIGTEPTWDKVERRTEQVMRAMNWYNYSFGKKEAQEFIADWLERAGRQAEAKKVKQASDSNVRITVGWMCRMATVGLELTEKEVEFIETDLKRLTATQKREVKSTDKVVAAKPNIQDRLREKMIECAAELEGMYDDFLLAGCKMDSSVKPIAAIRAMNVAPPMVAEIVKAWTVRLEELKEVQEGKDKDLADGYGCYGKIQVRNMIKFAEQVLADCASYVQIKKVERKPRKKKAISPERVVARVKYQVEDTKLSIKSENPTKLVNCTEIWLYDTKKRKLIHYVADQHVGTITVKGTSLIGFDPTASTMKTLRKPAEQLKGIMGSKPAARKHYGAIKAVEAKANGRFNDNILILKVY